MDNEQREFFDAFDDFTEQTWVSAQYVGLIVIRLVRWQREGRPLGPDTIGDWAREREYDEETVGRLEGIAIAAQVLETPEVRAVFP